MQQSSEQLKSPSNVGRAPRVFLKVSVVIRGCQAGGVPFLEHAHTQVISEAGALILLAANVQRGQPLRLTHRATGQEEECKVVSIGKRQGSQSEVGIEFIRPTPRFWHVDFPRQGYKPPTG